MKLMNEDLFFSHYPKRRSDSNKYDNGVVAFVSGSYGMAGAAILNLIGARSVGVSYIHSFLPHEIYPIVAAKEITAVYHPYDAQNQDQFKDRKLLRRIDAICIGSGINQLPYRKEYLSDLFDMADIPSIIDAEGIRILADDHELIRKNRNLILTPHMGEFAALCHKKISEIKKNREEIAVNYAKENSVILVLKGKNTLVVSPEGEVYVNDSGNEALARAGSGDILSGMVCGLCALYNDPYLATKDAVWLHGHLCDLAMKESSVEIFDLLSYPKLADSFFFGYRRHTEEN